MFTTETSASILDTTNKLCAWSATNCSSLHGHLILAPESVTQSFHVKMSIYAIESNMQWTTDSYKVFGPKCRLITCKWLFTIIYLLTNLSSESQHNFRWQASPGQGIIRDCCWRMISDGQQREWWSSNSATKERGVTGQEGKEMAKDEYWLSWSWWECVMYRLDAGPVPEIPEGVQGRHDGQEGRQISGMNIETFAVDRP